MSPDSQTSARERAPAMLGDLLVATLPVLLPLGVMVVEALLWDSIAPFGWLGFLPVVATCAWLCGLRGGLLAAALSIAGAEWLLTFEPDRPGYSLEAQIYSVLLFSALSVTVALLLHQVRRDSDRLHRAVAALRAASIGVTDALPPARWRAWRRHIQNDLQVIESVRQELEWRRRMLMALQYPMATFAPDGRCLYVNPAFLAALGLPDAAPGDWNLARRSDFPGTNLADAMERLMRAGDGRSVEPASLGVAGDAQLHWIAAGQTGVIVCTTLAPERASTDGAALRPAAQPVTPASPAPARERSAAGGAAVPAAGPARPGQFAQGLSGLRCLIVDDQELNRELLREILRLEGAQAVCCSSGREAVAAVRADPAGFRVVLMDLQMPGMDGYAAAQAIRRLVDARQLPIFAITADGPGIPTRRLLDAGMQGLLHKPLDVDQMVTLLAHAAASDATS